MRSCPGLICPVCRDKPGKEFRKPGQNGVSFPGILPRSALAANE
nr:MAG TPA: C2H2 type zinc-finger protein [Caudoviricetes sp.]DAR80238.1 MAG TPA: C2H2 type zinc-finger protein [Caudoviricetes sp.]